MYLPTLNRHKQQRRKYNTDKVLDLWAEGKTSTQIQKLTNVPSDYVRAMVTRARELKDKRAVRRHLKNQHDYD